MDEKKKPFIKRVLNLLAKSFFIPSIKFGSLKWPTVQIPLLRLRLPSVAGHRLELKFPQVSINLGALKLPGSFMKVTATGLSFGAISLAVVLVFAIQGTNASPIFPEPAQYQVAAVAADQTLKVGKKWTFEDTTPAAEREIQVNTLQINMSGARAADITLSDLEIGKSDLGTTAAIQILGDTSSTNLFYLECDEILITGVEAKTLNLANSEIYTLNILNNVADGISVGPTLNAAVLDITVTSTRGSVKVPAVTTGSFDKILIHTATAASQCRTLTISNVSAYGSGIDLDHIKAGTLTISSSKIGDGTGINAPSFVIAATTKIQVLNVTGNTEAPVSVK